jgi:hypothetical protein
LEDPVLNGLIVFERFFKREDRALSGLLCHRIGTGGRAVVSVAMNFRIA